jgi:hypothetical protein
VAVGGRQGPVARVEHVARQLPSDFGCFGNMAWKWGEVEEDERTTKLEADFGHCRWGIPGTDERGRALLRPVVLEGKLEIVLVRDWDITKSAVVETDVVIPSAGKTCVASWSESSGGSRGEATSGKKCRGLRQLHHDIL